MLTYQEAKYLDSLSDDCMCIEEFYRIWTLKESFVKAIGAGLAIGFDSLYVFKYESMSVITFKRWFTIIAQYILYIFFSNT